METAVNGKRMTNQLRTIADADHEQWLHDRRAGIGGSDVAPILGLSKWRTPLDVYRDKRGEGRQDVDNESMLWGRALEPVIRQQYADRTGRVVHLPDSMVFHPKHAFMLANLDGYTDDGRLLEVKTARSGQGWGEPGTDEIPEAYALQVQHYLCVTGYAVADVAVLISGSDFRLYEVHADRELQDMLIEAEAAFWQRVITGNEPEPITFAEVQQRYGRSNAAGAVLAGPEVAEAVIELARIKAQIKALEVAEEEAKAIVVRAFSDRGDTLIGKDRTLATWKLTKAPARFDTAAFKAAHPDLAAQFTRPGNPYRRLLIKESA